jgi:hypothetical protein
MSNLPERLAELEELLGALRDGPITAEQADRLEEILAADEAARTYYLEYITLCSTLRHYQGQSSPKGGDHGEDSATLPQALPLAPGPPQASVHPTVWRIRSSRRLLWLSTAAAILVGVLFVRLWPRGPQGVPVASGPPSPIAPATVPDNLALMIKVEGARWELEDQPPPAAGSVLKPRRLRLRSGRATLAFFNGVTMTVEGPADVDLVALDRVFCRRGKLRARVPRGAEGFIVASPGSAIVDLGTEFAINVEDDGRSQVMVFEGQAKAGLLDSEGSGRQTQLVETNASFEVDPHAGRITRTVAVPGDFVLAPSLAIPSLVLDPAYADAVLQSRPRAYWRFESLSGDAVPNTVPGGLPLRVSGPIGIDGGPEGNGYAAFKNGSPGQYMFVDKLWELPREPGHAVEFWFLTEGIRRGTLVGLFPPRELNPPDQASRYIHTFLVEQIEQERFSFFKPASVRFMHRWPIDMKADFNIFSEYFYVPWRWHHVVAQKNGARMELYHDGVPSLALPLDPDHPTLSCHLVVGRRTPDAQDPKDSRSFVGRLDELALYDHPLSAEEVRHHFELASQSAPPSQPGPGAGPRVR